MSARFYFKCSTCAGPTLNENYPQCTCCAPGRYPAYDSGFLDATAELLARVGDATSESPAGRAVADLHRIRDEYATHIARLELERNELRKALRIRPARRRASEEGGANE